METGLERRHDPIDVVHAAGPRTAARPLEGRPQAGIRRQSSAARGASPGCGARSPSSAAHVGAASACPAAPTRSTEPVSVPRSITISIRSSSRTRPIGPPCSASGPMCPTQAPLENPEKRPSVRSATCFPQGRYLSAVVICAVSCIPVPDGPVPISTITSPGRIGRSVPDPFTARIASRSSTNTRAGPRWRYT